MMRRRPLRDRYDRRRHYFGRGCEEQRFCSRARGWRAGAARALLKDRWAQDQDEIDLAAVAASRRIRMRARPFIGATILVAAASVELDLRRVLPAPTGVEVSVLMFGGSLRVVIPPGLAESRRRSTPEALGSVSPAGGPAMTPRCSG